MRGWTAGRLGIAAFGLACAVLLLIGWTSLRRMADLREASASVDRTLMVREAAEAFLSLLKDAETAQRGFVITGDDRYLERYDAARASIPQHLKRLRHLTADNPAQQASLVPLKELIQRKLDEVRDTIAAREQGGFEAAARIIASGEGRRAMDEIRAVIVAMREEEDRLLTKRHAIEERQARVATITSLGGLAVALGLLVAAGLLLNRAVLGRERARAERTTAQTLAAALGQSEAWLRVTLTSIGDAVVATDERGRVKLMNRVAESLTGWSEADAAGRPLSDLFLSGRSRRASERPSDAAPAAETIAGLVSNTVLVTKDGRNVPVDGNAAPILAPDGTLLGVVLVFRDVSVRRQLERERAVLLEKEQEASRAKDVFLALVSHELRTPLTAVLGWVKMLRAGGLDRSTTARALDVIERNTSHQSRLIDDLLDVSRIVAGKLTLELGPVDLARAVETAVDSVRPWARERDIHVGSEIDRTLAPLRGDAARLQQVLGNLLTNAVKFSSAGGRVNVRLLRTPDGARVTVSDTGQGIDPALLPHVFEPFRQARPATDRADGGLGLGLAIVRQLVELHGGRVSVSSDGPGKGATFTVNLPSAPVAAGEVTASDPASDREDNDDGDLQSVRGLRVLVVDDDPDIRELMTTTLAYYGAEPSAVASVAEARRVFAKSPPEVLICDIAMPHEDGWRLIEDVRGRRPDEGGAVPAIAVSAFAGPGDRERALAAGFQRYLRKPVDLFQLVASVAAVHGKHSTSRASTASPSSP